MCINVGKHSHPVMEGEVIAFMRLNWSCRGFWGLLVNNDFGLTWFVWCVLSAGLLFPLGCVAINKVYGWGNEAARLRTITSHSSLLDT